MGVRLEKTASGENGKQNNGLIFFFPLFVLFKVLLQ